MPFDKLEQFTKRVSDLADSPSENMTPTELKAYFDSSPEELRTSLNQLVDDLNADTAAGTIGAKDSNGSASNIQALVDANTKSVKDHKEKAELDHPDGSVTKRKLSADLNDRLDKYGGLQAQVNQLVVSGDSSVEAAQARVKADGTSYTTLRDRLNNADEQLAERPTQTDLTNAVSPKADKTYVDTELGKKASTSYVDTKTASIASGSPKGTYATVTDLTNAFPSGNTNIYIVTANGNWYYWSGTAWTAGGVYQSTGIADKTVTEVKTSFITTGKNLFNKATAQVGYYIYDVDGKVYANASYSASDYVEIEPSISYSRNMGTTASRYAWYDSGKTFISGGVTGPTITSPANAKYIRFSVDNTIINTYQFEKGSAATPYDSFYYKLASVKATPEKGSVSNESLVDKSVSASKTDFVIPGKNKFDKSKVTAGYYVNNANGVLQANANYAASDFIEVEPDTDYVDNSGGYYLAFYDANKAYISGLGLAHAKTYRTPANAKYIRLSVPNNLVSSMQFEKGTVSTEYQAFGYVIQNGLYQVASNATSFKVEINLPSKIYGLVGQELNIYFDNIVNVKDVNYDFDVVADVGDQFEQYFRFTPTAAGSFAITIKALLNGSEVASASSTLIVKASSVGTGINKKLILIGDSTTDNGYPSIKLNENFNADPMDITLMGTRGTSPNLHEGRSGWKAKDYVESASLSGVTNAFWNPTTSAFDFSYYISNNGFSVPDYVVINLGINDTFNYLDDASLNTEMTNIISRYDQVISSIKAYNANIKIGIALTIPPNYSQDAFGKAYDAGQTRARYKRNNFLWVQKLIATYQNREAENLYLVPIHLNIDTRYGYGLESTQVNARNTMTVQMPVANGGVHPGVSGYWQIADTYWYWLKSFES